MTEFLHNCRQDVENRHSGTVLPPRPLDRPESVQATRHKLQPSAEIRWEMDWLLGSIALGSRRRQLVVRTLEHVREPSSSVPSHRPAINRGRPWRRAASVSPGEMGTGTWRRPVRRRFVMIRPSCW